MIFAALVITLALQASPAKACLVNGERLRGELRFVETHHPNGTLIRSAILHLTEPRCVDDPDMGRAEGQWVQIAPAEQGAFTSVPSGSDIVIEAEEYFTPHTAWHVGDIVAIGVRVAGYELQ